MLLPAIHTWQEWGAMFTDAQQWQAAVEEICHREGIAFRQIEAGYPGTNAVFILDQAYVVKVYAPFCHEDFDMERAIYPLLTARTSIPAPRLLTQGILNDQIAWPYIVMDFKPGQPIRQVREQISQDNLLDIAAALGEMARELHAVPLAQLDRTGLSAGDWPALAQTYQTNSINKLRRKAILPQAVLDQVEATVAEEVRERDNPLLLINGDLTEDHLLLEEQNGQWRISGLLDFADSLIGPREYEWIALWFSALDRNKACLRAFMKSYNPAIALGEAFFKTVTAFTFLHEFGAEIVEMTLKRLGNPVIRSIEELQEALWE